MTLAEFKAWLKGFSENMEGDCPTAEQWQRITAQIDATSLTLANQNHQNITPNQSELGYNQQANTCRS